MVTTGGRPQLGQVVNGWSAWFAKQVMTSNCYPAWCNFKGLFPRLVAAAGTDCEDKFKDNATLLENLALTDPLGDDLPGTDGVSVLNRTTFSTAGSGRPSSLIG